VHLVRRFARGLSQAALTGTNTYPGEGAWRMRETIHR
jgi:hypothetical protein